jgi:hypothetical protein
MNTLLKNLVLRLTALLCALLLWFYATLNRKYETTITIPIRLINIQPGIGPSNEFPLNAKVLVSGTGRQLFMFKFSEAELLVNAERAAPGMSVFRISGENVEIRGNPGVRVLFVKEPVQLAIRFDAIVKREVPIEPDINVVTAQDRILLSGPRLSPDRAIIAGPRCNAAQVDTLRTRHVEISRLGGDTSFFAFIRNPDLYGLDITPNKVRVSLEAGPVVKVRLDSIPVRLVDVPPGAEARLDARFASILIAGAGKDVESIRRENVNIYVSYRRFSVEQLEEAEPAVSIIGNVQWSNLEPKTVRLAGKHP